MQTVLADLHVHTLLSPCAEVEMTPHHIVMRAAEYGIGAVAITDHNASANVPAALEAAQRYGVKVFPGMEVESSEEAHIVALFDTLEQLQSWQLVVDEHMNGMLNDAERFGAQYVVDAEDEFVREEQRLLHAPLSLTAAQVVQQVAALGGLTIAAHIDRPSYSIWDSLVLLSRTSALLLPKFLQQAGSVSCSRSCSVWQAICRLLRIPMHIIFMILCRDRKIYSRWRN